MTAAPSERDDPYARLILSGMVGRASAARVLKLAAAKLRRNLPSYRVVGPDAIAVTMPASLAPGEYAFVVHNAFSGGAWAFLTVT